MATRFRVQRIETGGVLQPREGWLDNQNEFASEFNGYLDRDNIPASAINETRIVNNAFHDLFFDTVDVVWNADGGVLGWQHEDGAGVALPEISRFLAFDSLLLVQASIWYQYSGGGGLADQDATIVDFRIAMDGITLDQTGPISRFHRRHGAHLLGVIPIPAGDHRVHLDCRVSFDVAGTGAITLLDTATPGAPSLAVQAGELVVLQRKR